MVQITYLNNKLSDTNDICLLCLEKINTKKYILPNNCKCKLKIHQNCFNKIISTGLLCPICRIKANDITNTTNTTLVRYENDSWINMPIYLFTKYPNFLTFILWLIISTIFTIVYITPMAIYYGLKDAKYKNNIIGTLFLISFFIIYLL